MVYSIQRCLQLMISAALFLATVGQNTSLGDRLLRDYTEYYSFPTTTAEATKAGGWSPGNGSYCDPDLGVLWVQQGGGEESHPLYAYFTPAGQVAGVGVVLVSKWGHVSHGVWRSYFFRLGPLR